ncbi:MAG: transcriptional regulator [Bacteroidia bacterium]|nr:transcriptional regulator [Bacteroidia bacterium]MDW8089076.1 transcriptional regulator [Bacteroidia bacterium]
MYQSKGISLTPAQQNLIELWGKLAYAWGVGPTMAQLFALLYVFPEPLDTDTLMEVLQISRGNVSINLRKLLDWKLIHKIDLPGTRRALYTAERDIWLIATRIIQKRLEREITPIQHFLKDALENQATTLDAHTTQSLRQMLEVVEAIHLVTQIAIPVLMTNERQRVMNLLAHWQRRFGQEKRSGDNIPGSNAGGSV